VAPVAGAERWQSVGPYGGNLSGLAAAPSAPHVVYLGSHYGLHRSNDAGESWRPVRGGELVAPLLVDPRDAEVVYGSRIEGNELRLVRSEDGGRTWQHADQALVDAAGHRLHVFALVSPPEAPRRLLAATSRGLFASVTRGRAWELLAFPEAAVTALATAPEGGRLWAWAGGDAGPRPDVWVSGDGGASWSPTGWPEGRFVERLRALDRQAVVALSQGDVFLRLGAGRWRPLDRPAAGLSIIDVAFAGGQLFAATEYGVYRSLDRGVTWTPRIADLDEAGPRDLVHTLAALPGGGTVLGSGYAGVWKWAPGEGWRASSRGVSTQRIDALAVAADGRLLASVSLQGLFASADRGAAWGRRNGGLALLPSRFADNVAAFTIPSVAFAPSDPDVAYAVVCRPRPGCAVGRSEDGGLTWSEGTRPAALQPQDALRRLFVDPRTPATLWAIAIDYRDANPRWQLLRSDDAGATWTRRLEDRLGIATLAIDPDDPQTLYAWTFHGLQRSRDGGRGWTTVGAGLAGISSSEDQTVALDPRDPRRVYVATVRGVVVSDDRGTTFRPVGHDGLPTFVQPLRLLVHPRQPERLFLVEPRTVHAWDPDRRVWERLDAGLRSDYIGALEIEPEGRFLYAGTVDRGVFRFDLEAAR
jgi:photosystem II stability/assembly factor-like uncharacterized protein